MKEVYESIGYLGAGALIGGLIIYLFNYLRDLRTCANIPKRIFKESNKAGKLLEELKKPKYHLPFINDEVKFMVWVKQNKKKTIITLVILFLILASLL